MSSAGLLVAFCAVWAIVATAMLVFVVVRGNPLPFFGKGHRLLGASGPEAALAGEEIFALGGLKRRFFMKPGPTNQLVFWDGTVINWLDNDPRFEGWPSGGISLIADDPGWASACAETILEKRGFDAQVQAFPSINGKVRMFVLRCERAFPGAVITFRHQDYRMGRPPVQEFPAKEK